MCFLSNMVYFHISGKLVVTINGFTELNEGEELVLTCDPSVSHESLVFSWLYSFENENEIPRTLLYSSQVYRTTAALNTTGTYTCHVQSELGEAEDSVYVTVLEKGANKDPQVESSNTDIISYSIIGLAIIIIAAAVAGYFYHKYRKTTKEREYIVWKPCHTRKFVYHPKYWNVSIQRMVKLLSGKMKLIF